MYQFSLCSSHLEAGTYEESVKCEHIFTTKEMLGSPWKSICPQMYLDHIISRTNLYSGSWTRLQQKKVLFNLTLESFQQVALAIGIISSPLLHLHSNP